MNAVLFIGLQASGKSTFFQRRFAKTHVRINLDMLRTRHREARLIETCIEIGQPFVIDNTNICRADRQRYMPRLAADQIEVHGYYFQSSIELCKFRNGSRCDHERVPLEGLLGTHARLEVPHFSEGFNQLSYVRIDDSQGFVVEEWRP